MNQFRTRLAIFFAVFLLAAPLASAQLAPKPATAPVAPVAISAGIDGAEPLAVRKARVETGLRDLLTRFGTAYARTQFALTRLTDKDGNLATAQAELVKAGVALQAAKANIDAFTATAITGDNTAVTLALRTKALASEENLRTVKTSLLTSIGALRLSLPPVPVQ